MNTPILMPILMPKPKSFLWTIFTKKRNPRIDLVKKFYQEAFRLQLDCSSDYVPGDEIDGNIRRIFFPKSVLDAESIWAGFSRLGVKSQKFLPNIDSVKLTDQYQPRFGLDFYDFAYERTPFPDPLEDTSFKESHMTIEELMISSLYEYWKSKFVMNRETVAVSSTMTESGYVLCFCWSEEYGFCVSKCLQSIPYNPEPGEIVYGMRKVTIFPH